MTADPLQPMCPDCRENEDTSLTCDPTLTLCLRYGLGEVRAQIVTVTGPETMSA